MLFIALAYIIITVSFAGIYVSFQESEEFGFIIIDPNQEPETIFVVCILASSFTLNDSWITKTDFSMLPNAEYTFSEKALYIELFSHETITGEIIPHPNITTHYIEVQIIKENCFMKIEMYDFLGTFLCFRFTQKVLNITIQPLIFYKWEVLD